MPRITLPRTVPISDTELCSILSNGLENALHAVSALPEQEKRMELYCDVRFKKLLIEIKNPYKGEIDFQNGLPVATGDGHGYGCLSIRTIAEQNGGLCSFETGDGIFTVRIILPLSDRKKPS